MQYADHGGALRYQRAHGFHPVSLVGRIEVGDLTRNPLPNSYELDVRSAESLDTVASRAKRIVGVSDVKYGEEIAQRMLNFNAMVRSVGAVILGLLFLSTVLIVSNTIRLTVFARRKEIEIMQMVGAAEWFIRWPFILEGAWTGLLGAILPILIVDGQYFWMYGVITSSLSGTSYSLLTPGTFLWEIDVLLATIGIIIGALGSGLSMSRFLKI